jgi:methylmalonyl-CoA mutase
MSETEPTGSLFSEFPAVAPEAWTDKVASETGRSPDEVLEWSSVEGMTIPASLRQDALDEALHVDPDADFPPLAESTTAPANDWRLCQPVRHSDPSTANEHARTAVEQGVRTLDLVVSPTSDSPGLAVRGVEDLATLLDGINLTETRLHLGRGLAAPTLYAILRTLCSDRALDPTTLQGSIGYDPVAVLISSPRLSEDTAFRWANALVAETSPQLRAVTVNARVYHEAGASAVQELAATLGALTERLAHSTDAGTPLVTLLDNLQVTVPISTSYFVEIAKLRALRLLVPQVVEAFSEAASFGLADLTIRAETSRRRETIYDPYVNMLRATTEAMAAVLGGCDTLSIHPYDAVLRPPDGFGLRIARNTQHILRHESHLAQVTDPAAGSYYIETLTDELAQRAWEQFQEIEARGGLIETLQTGTLQDDIAETRHERREALDDRTQVLVGTTHYPNLDEHRGDDLIRSASPAPNGESAPALDPPSVEALRSSLQDGATLPGLTAALRDEPSDIAPLPRVRVSEPTESIRLRTEAYADAHGSPPQVLLAPMGPPAARSARATFARNFLGVAGFAIEAPLMFDTIEEATEAAVEQNADLVVLCSSNAEYSDLAPSLASALAERGHEALLGIAGSPDDIDVGGIADVFVHQDAPLHNTLETLQEHLGIPSRE